MKRDDLPFRAMAAMGEVVFEVAEEVAGEAIERHVEEYHARLPAPRYDTPEEVPFQEEHVPDPIIRRILERLSPSSEESNNEDFYSVCRDAGYPPLLVEREISRFLGANKRFNIMLRG